MKKVKPALDALAVLFLFAFSMNAFAEKTTLTWDELDGVRSYKVEIKDMEGDIVLRKNVSRGQVDFSLPPGSYRINIKSIDYSGHISAKSGWQYFSVEKKEPLKIKEKKKKKKEKAVKKKKRKKPKRRGKKAGKDYVKNLAGAGLKLSAGYMYTMPLESWRDYNNDSYIGALFRMTLILGDIRSLRKYRFLRSFGLEIDSSYIQFDGKTRTDIIPFDSRVIPVSGNIVFTSGINFPLNLFVRFGGGLAFTSFEYFNTNPGEDYDSWSTDPYYTCGLSLEITFAKFMFFEIGADFMYIDYKGDAFMGLRYVGMIGIRI